MSMGRRMILTAVLLGVLGVELGPVGAPALAAKAHAYESQLSGTSLTEPFGVAVNPTTSQAYVADKVTSIISVFNAKGEFESSFTGPFSAPRAVTVNPVTNDVYVSAGEGEPSVTELDAKGTFIRSLTGPAFGRLVSVAAYGGTGNVYVADAETSVVDVFNAAGALLTQLTAGAPGVPFSGVAGVAVNQSTGQLYVGDSGSGTVDVFNSKDEYQFHFTGSETPGGSFLPFRDAVDSSTGEVYVADLEHGVVDVFNAAGEYQSQFSGIETPAESIEPYGLSVDPSTGKVYVADRGHGVVDVFKSLPLPSVKTETASPVAATTAELQGVINAEGLAEVTYFFEYGTSATFDPEAGTLSTPEVSDSTAGPVAVSAPVTELQPGTLYHVRLSAKSPNGTIHGRDTTFVTSSLPPVVSSATSSNLTAFAATLSGSIIPGGSATSYHFVYGPTSDYGQSTRTEGVGGLEETAVTPQRIGGLVPGTVYHFALVAENSAGSTESTDQTFTTNSLLAPEVATGAAIGISATTATLQAAVNPRGVPTTYSFQVGTDTNYGTLLSGSAGAAQTAGTVSAALSGLAPGSTVHFRVLASSAGGTVYGQDVTFTTPLLAATILAPVTPLLVPVPPVTPPPPLVVVSRRLSGKRVLVSLRLTAKGTVTITGGAIKTYKASLAAGTHRITLSLSKAGLKDRTHRRTITLKFAFKAGTAAVVNRSTTLRL